VGQYQVSWVQVSVSEVTPWWGVNAGILQMIILIAPNFIGRDNTPVTIPRLAVG